MKDQTTFEVQYTGYARGANGERLMASPPTPGGADEIRRRLWDLARQGTGAGSNMLHNLLNVETMNGSLDWREAALHLAELANRMHEVATKATALQCPSITVHLDADSPK